MVIFNIVKTLIFMTLMGGTVMVLIPYWIIFNSRFNLDMGILRYFGIIPVLIGAAIIFWCVREFILRGKGTPAPYDPPKELVVSGLYRFMRNPMYVGVLFVLFGEAFLFTSALLLCYMGLILLLFHIRIILNEEPYLRSTFGESFNQYCDSVPRWVFRLK